MMRDNPPTISTFARRGQDFLFHLAFLPTLAIQKSVVALSANLNRTSYPHSFYELRTGEPGSTTCVKTMAEGASPLTGRMSLPHMTIMHFWATAHQAESISHAFAKAQKETTLPRSATIRGVSFFASLPRFLGEEGQKDAVAWVDVHRSSDFVSLQSRFYDAVVEKGGTPITALGDRWNPHWTLLAEPRELIANAQRRIVFEETDLLPVGVKSGDVVLGLSGPNGQFRGVLSPAPTFTAALMPAPRVP